MKVETLHRSPAASELARRKAISRAHLRSLTPEEKIRLLMNLQEQYYQFLVLGESNFGRPIPERWKKWRSARELPDVS